MPLPDGKDGLLRNLTAAEIVGQVRVLADALGFRDKPFNIVLMGMGEPLHNYDETMKALRILADEHGLALPPRRVTLSTVGVLPALERLAHEPIMPNLRSPCTPRRTCSGESSPSIGSLSPRSSTRVNGFSRRRSRITFVRPSGRSERRTRISGSALLAGVK